MLNSISAVNNNSGKKINFGMYVEPKGEVAEQLGKVVNNFSDIGKKEIQEILQGAKKEFAPSNVDLQFVSDEKKLGLDFFKRDSEPKLDAFTTFAENPTEQGFIGQLKQIVNAAKTFAQDLLDSPQISTTGAKTYVA